MQIVYRDKPNSADFSVKNFFMPGGIASNARQRRKIVGSFKNPKMILKPDLDVTQSDFDAFFAELSSEGGTHKVSVEKRFQKLISVINGNLLKLKLSPMFSLIQENKRLCGILAYYALGSLNKRNKITEDDILVFLRKYPNPYSFQFRAGSFLDKIESSNGKGKREIYEQAMKSFMEILYGKQFEYLMQINLLRLEAESYNVEKTVEYNDEIETLTVEKMSGERGGEILDTLEVRGDPFNKRMLSADILVRNGLFPRYKMSLKGCEMAYFSAIYTIGLGRKAVVAFLRKDGKWIPRSYYFSNSHGLWRYLEGYMMLEGKIISYGQGKKRRSMNLPLVFQKVLARISEASQVVDVEDSEFIFAGTAPNILFNTKDHGSTYIQATARSSRKLCGTFYHGSEKRTPPEEMRFHDDGQIPDYTKFVTSWDAQNKLYGRLVYEVFLSRDRKLIYTFCRDRAGRKWLACVENHSPILVAGLREVWIDAGDLDTPVYEYMSKAKGYGNKELIHGNYIDMHKHYLSKIWTR
ncbi:MAG: hypothetical protein GY757_46755 [bacterium]|nr:hypothetical protein [bacterium]